MAIDRYLKPAGLVAAALAATAGTALAQPEASDFFGGMWGTHSGWGYMGHGMGILFWILIIAVVVLMVRWASNGSQKNPGSGSALDILRTRFANGEIDQSEYEAKRKILTAV